MEATKEKLKFYTEYLKLLWILEVAIGGGLISLLFSLDSAMKVLIFTGGIFVFFSILIAIIRLTLAIKMLLIKLEEEEERNGYL